PHFIRFNKQADKINIVAHFVEYKTFLAEQKQPDLKLGITPIGVSGIIVLKEATNQYVFFARRAPHVTEYPGFLELVPSGSLDEGCVDASGIVYYQSQLLREFVEETGLPQEYVKDISGFALVLDTNHHVYDICCEISLEAKKEFILKEFSSDEYNDPAFVAMNDLDHFIKSNCDSIVPTSLALIEAYLQIAL
ncbi:MAG: NUDIX hydrolase, partial [uncultured bacterium]